MKSAIHVFSAVLERSGDGIDAAFISIPFDVQEKYGTRGQVKVKATFDGHPYRGVLANMGTGCHAIGVRKDIRKAIGKSFGDRVKVTIEQVKEERKVELPAELLRLLKKDPSAKSFFDSLSFTNRKEYVQWINSAKKEETRKSRLSQIVTKLGAGKRNPSEK